MKATVIKFYDEQGNEIKNVSTEILVNGETYVKKEADKQPDYSHLVGMWVKCVNSGFNIRKNTWYFIELVENNRLHLVYNDGSSQKCLGSYVINHFDLTNPLPYNPETVVGLKELPNDGKTYVECLETRVFSDGKPYAYKGLFYKVTNHGSMIEFLSDESGDPHVMGVDFYKSYFLIHTPAKPIWETCRETMWEYDNEVEIETLDSMNDDQDTSLQKLTKHLNALAYLSEVARRCNGDRVVDWTDATQPKYSVRRQKNHLEVIGSEFYYREIIFLDREARDHSFEVDKNIWLDYYDLPNE